MSVSDVPPSIADFVAAMVGYAALCPPYEGIVD